MALSFRLPRRVAAVAAGVVAIALALGAAGRTEAGRACILQGFFHAHQAWQENWPLPKGRHLIARFIPALRLLGLLEPVRIEIEPQVSLLLDPLDRVAQNILASGEWEPEIWNVMSQALPASGVFLDVGAHIGYYSLKSAKVVGPAGRVLSFEPNPLTLTILRENVAASRAAQVTIVPIACTDQEQTLTFFTAPQRNTGASSLSRVSAAEGTNAAVDTVAVQGRPLDHVVRELGIARVDVVKIDVEGAELLVLRGARETLTRFHPKLIIEIKPNLLANLQAQPEAVFSLLAEIGYTRRAPINEDNWEWSVQ